MSWLNGKKSYIGLFLIAIMYLIDYRTNQIGETIAGSGLWDIPDKWYILVETVLGVGVIHKLAKAAK